MTFAEIGAAMGITEGEASGIYRAGLRSLSRNVPNSLKLLRLYASELAATRGNQKRGMS
jgi:hypothetical protein